MKLIMTLLVRDEEDVLRANIDFHLSQGVDYIIVTDNLSVDSTKDILMEYEKKGVLHYIYEQDDNFNQHTWVSRMARMAAEKYDAAWVINNDADEFWLPKSGTLKETFSSIPSKYNVLQSERYNFVPMINSDISSPFYQLMIYQEVESLNPLGKPLPAKQAHIGNKEVIVGQGNHNVDNIGEQFILQDLINIYHYPIRSYAQIENSIIKLGAAYERNTELSASLGITRRVLYDGYKQKGNVHNYYNHRVYDDARIAGELEAGKIIKNTCMQEYFSHLYKKYS